MHKIDSVAVLTIFVSRWEKTDKVEVEVASWSALLCCQPDVRSFKRHISTHGSIEGDCKSIIAIWSVLRRHQLIGMLDPLIGPVAF